MSLYRLTKTMPRRLTQEEEQEVKAWLSAQDENNPDFANQAVARFELKFGTPITLACIQIITVRLIVDQMKERDDVCP